MRVLITGSNGFLGNHLLNYLSGKKIDVLGIDLDNSKKINFCKIHFNTRLLILRT